MTCRGCLSPFGQFPPFTRGVVTRSSRDLARALIAIALSLWLGIGLTAHAGPTGAAADAYAAFSRQDYDTAISTLRRHLRSNGHDYYAWDLLAASYYHIGMPKRALRYLKTVGKKSPEPAFNLYYQGLSHLALRETSKAEEVFQKAGNSLNECGWKSLFELAVIDYKSREKDRARYWLTTYLQRSPQGVYRAQAISMLKSLDDGVWLDDVEGAPRPDADEALYRHSKLSLTPSPHFWMVGIGYRGQSTTSMEPAQDGTLGERQEMAHSLDIDSGIGIGPVRKGDSTVMGGYNYRQRWITDDDRLSTYFADPTDFSYQPFRADMLERRHQLWGDARYSIQKKYFLGVFGRFEYVRIGSRFFGSPDSSELRQVFPISDSTLVIPWAGASWRKDMRTSAYLYIRKEINTEAPENSNKTFSFGTPFASSIGLSHAMDFEPINTYVNVDLFRYEFIYNDYWLDYTRLGGLASVEHYPLSSLSVSLTAGMYTDTYQLDRIKMHACSSKPAGTQSSASDTNKPRTCPRVDSGMMVEGGLAWYYTQFQRVSGSILFVTNDNPDMQEFQQVRQVYKAGVTMAFPSVRRVVRYVERFADTAFTKEAQ